MVLFVHMFRESIHESLNLEMILARSHHVYSERLSDSIDTAINYSNPPMFEKKLISTPNPLMEVE
jgi:hypothetical protein